MTIIGVTGSFGTGKTTVAAMFAQLGAEVIDADKIAHELLHPETGEWDEVLSCFGREILNPDKSINRAKLADMVFRREEQLKKLCAIIHPGVIEGIKKRLFEIEKTTPHKIVIIDAPLLIEAGLTGITDKLIVVKAGRDKQLSRCRKRTGLSEIEIENRIKNQFPLEEKIKLADYVVDNNNTLKETIKQAEEIWKKIIKM